MTGASTSVVSTGVTVDGLEQRRRTWPVDDPVAFVLMVHGINEHSGRHERLGRQLSRAGFHTEAFDLRGFGASGGPRGDVDRFDRYVDDVAERLDDIGRRAREHDVPVVLLGHSMGGLIALRYALSDHPKPDLLILSGPALGTGAPRWARVGAKPLARLLPGLRVPSPFDSSVLSRDRAVCADFDADPLTETRTSARLGAELFGAAEAARRALAARDTLGVPTLVIHGGDDILVPTASTEILGTLHDVERRVLPGLRHEPLQEPEGLQVADMIVEWLRARLPARAT